MLAIDPSLTSSGYAFRSIDDPEELCLGRIMPKTLRGVQRLQFIEGTFKELLARSTATTIVMEGYSMSSHGRVFDIGELGGVLKLCALKLQKEILIVPPATLKKWVTGKGNADKKAMADHVRRRWKIESNNNDECDAVALLHFGEFYYQHANNRRKSPEIRTMLAKCTVEAGE